MGGGGESAAQHLVSLFSPIFWTHATLNLQFLLTRSRPQNHMAPREARSREELPVPGPHGSPSQIQDDGGNQKTITQQK